MIAVLVVRSAGVKMHLQANQISRDWTVLHGGRKFYVNYTQSDGPDGQAKTDANFKRMKKLIRFCIEHWDSGFMREINEQLQEQKQALESL